MESEKLRVLQDNFYIFFRLEPLEDVYIEIYDIDKFGIAKLHEDPRIYKGQTLREAVDKAYRGEFNKDTVGGRWNTLMIRIKNFLNFA